jgi:hypothetical protein
MGSVSRSMFSVACRGSRLPARWSFAIVALALLWSLGAQPARSSGPTHVAARTYSTNTTWTLANSPYVIDGTVTVAAGATLTIEPGVVVKLNGQTRAINVYGSLKAVGTAADRIVFTSIQDDSVGGEIFGEDRAGEAFGDVGFRADGDEEVISDGGGRDFFQPVGISFDAGSDSLGEITGGGRTDFAEYREAGVGILGIGKIHRSDINSGLRVDE